MRGVTQRHRLGPACGMEHQRPGPCAAIGGQQADMAQPVIGKHRTEPLASVPQRAMPGSLDVHGIHRIAGGRMIHPGVIGEKPCRKVIGHHAFRQRGAHRHAIQSGSWCGSGGKPVDTLRANCGRTASADRRPLPLAADGGQARAQKRPLRPLCRARDQAGQDQLATGLRFGKPGLPRPAPKGLPEQRNEPPTTEPEGLLRPHRGHRGLPAAAAIL